jgi:steroid Delta-isomerase
MRNFKFKNTMPQMQELRAAQDFLNQTSDFFAALTAANLTQLPSFYATDARFKDPFNEVQGVAEVARIFAHMFATLDQPRFVIKTQSLQGNNAFITWDFLFKSTKKSSQTWCIRGASHLTLTLEDRGVWRISDHRDYWDAAEELYAKLPVVGHLMRWLQRRLSSQHHAMVAASAPISTDA